ncbi:MAG: glycosyltransferase family 8 protein [Ruminococcaceae bacterium]|nr:glycosyltransferase family 8 protein [Oscillospiraceae bacterium]
MNILYCGDKNIADGLMMSLISLTDYNKEPLNVYVLTMSVETEKGLFEPLDNSFAVFMDRFLKEKNSQSSFTLIDMTKEFVAEFPVANAETRFTPGCMLRLYADSVFSLPSKILYLDNDVICRGSIAPLYNTDMTDTELAGTLDYYGRWFFRNNIMKMDYLNSGVLLLNMDKIRQTSLFTRCRQRCKEKQMFMPDQSALNKLAVSKKILPRKFNEQRKIRSDTILQHFTTSFRFFPYIRTVTVKPWQIDKVRSVLGLDCYDELYNRFLNLKKQYTEYVKKEICI